MPTPLDEPLYQTSVKLFESDVEWLKKNIGPGWTEHIRDTMRREVNHLKQVRKVEIKL